MPTFTIHTLAAFLFTCVPTLDPPANAEEFLARGVTRAQSGDLDKAIEDFTEAIRLDPKAAYAYSNRGGAYGEKGVFDKALQDHNQAISLKSDVPVFLYNRGLILRKMGEVDKAITDFTETIRIDSKFSPAYRDRGAAWVAKHDFDKAMVDYNEAIRLNPKDPLTHFNRATIFDERREWKKALDGYSEAIELNPKLEAAFLLRSLLHATCPDAAYRDGKKAIADATRACELTGWKNPARWEALAAAYAEEGRFAEAVKWQRKVIESAGDDKVQRENALGLLKLYEAERPVRKP